MWRKEIKSWWTAHNISMLIREEMTQKWAKGNERIGFMAPICFQYKHNWL